MSTITKEWLQKAISQHESMRDEIPFGLDEDDSNTLEALRIALSSLEAEAVADVVAWSSPNEERTCDVRLRRHDINAGPLYTAPPAPVSVPDEDLLHMAASAIEDLLSSKDRSGAGVWADIPAKLRRAAMLQGADGNSPVIPDGVCPCCGRKPLKNRTCSVSGCDGKHVARGFCIKHYAIERKKDPSRRKSIRAADKRYRARKAAAPQQEAE
ncbi:hypothetical protein ROT99_01895 [Citrobacter freundii complex sp. 2023EL-00966]|uniref:hypothetical protein n=1 Tax=Citrobacter freundii complex sp. 2023EL-00966 TaxID=3076118 RepID=UPI00289388A9|nr:hypothetical protein [Citrobacter freundii complex sp. 2023EL-00966]MDT3751123.1 hypothetical protein [Citrobacter freundii complex sp. 2023EL-00966]